MTPSHLHRVPWTAVVMLGCSAGTGHTTLQAAQCHKILLRFRVQVVYAKVVITTSSEGFSSLQFLTA